MFGTSVLGAWFQKCSWCSFWDFVRIMIVWLFGFGVLFVKIIIYVVGTLAQLAAKHVEFKLRRSSRQAKWSPEIFRKKQDCHWEKLSWAQIGSTCHKPLQIVKRTMYISFEIHRKNGVHLLSSGFRETTTNKFSWLPQATTTSLAIKYIKTCICFRWVLHSKKQPQAITVLSVVPANANLAIKDKKNVRLTWGSQWKHYVHLLIYGFRNLFLIAHGSVQLRIWKEKCIVTFEIPW